jgi:hypothetical protein
MSAASLDLFSTTEARPHPNPIPQARGSRPAASGREYVKVECGFCGAKGGAYVEHYEKVYCSCGKTFWALRPFRSGPLELRPWPGDVFKKAA